VSSELHDQMEAVDRAVEIIRSHFDVGMALILTRYDDPSALPEYGETPTVDAICRKTVAHLLNEGWVPPKPPEAQR
jgi:hypothetical protein